ncbi:MAG: PEGA domain-containing protein [Methanoregula sp.]|nr:PEGA domain-containing protein [Methanoregula sp.]
MKKTCTLLIILVMAVLMVVPVSADSGNTTNTTTVPTSVETTVTTPVTPEPTTTTAAVTTTTAVPATTTSAETKLKTTKVPATTVTTTVPVFQTTQASTGNLSVASTPMGASILIDGVYYGTTPGTLADISAGNHILRLALSGYYDYEGTIYVVPGQANSAFGTLPPLSGYSTAQSTTVATAATAVPTAAPVIIVQTVEPTATETSSAGALENPTVIAAVIGIITAAIGAGATIYTHKPAEAPKEEKK